MELPHKTSRTTEGQMDGGRSAHRLGDPQRKHRRSTASKSATNMGSCQLDNYSKDPTVRADKTWVARSSHQKKRTRSNKMSKVEEEEAEAKESHSLKHHQELGGTVWLCLTKKKNCKHTPMCRCGVGPVRSLVGNSLPLLTEMARDASEKM